MQDSNIKNFLRTFNLSLWFIPGTDTAACCCCCWTGKSLLRWDRRNELLLKNRKKCQNDASNSWFVGKTLKSYYSPEWKDITCRTQDSWSKVWFTFAPQFSTQKRKHLGIPVLVDRVDAAWTELRRPPQRIGRPETDRISERPTSLDVADGQTGTRRHGFGPETD